MHKKISKAALSSLMSAAMLATSVAAVAPMTVNAGQVLGNGDFDDGTSLPWHTCESQPAKQTFEIKDGKYVVHIVDSENGPEGRWDLQFRHRGLNIIKGHKYTISGDIEADADGYIYAKVGNYQGDKEYWHGISGQEWQPYKIKKGEKFERVEDNFVWLAKAGIALPVYNVDLPRIPLELAKKSNLFKLFMNDVGLLAAQYMDGIQLEILNGNLDVNFGAVFENFVAEELTAHGYDKLYYFNSKKHGEVDFLVEKGGAVLPLEVKSGSGYKAHAALDNMMAVPDYGLENAVVYNTQGRIEDLGRVACLPIYALMFLSRDALPANAVYKLDL